MNIFYLLISECEKLLTLKNETLKLLKDLKQYLCVLK